MATMNPVKPASDIINEIIAVIMSEVTELTSQSAILQYIPRIASAIHPVAVPGSEKKALVIQALHTLLSKLFEADKITKEFKEITDAFVDEVAPITIDTIINVASGKVTFTKEQAVEVAATVVSTGCKICLPFLIKKLTKSAVPAIETKVAEVTKEVETKVAEVTKEVETKVAEAVELTNVVEIIVEAPVEQVDIDKSVEVSEATLV